MVAASDSPDDPLSEARLFRIAAADCLQQADDAADSEIRASYMSLARSYMDLADDMELIYENRTCREALLGPAIRAAKF